MNKDNAIEVSSLSKSFGMLKALDGVTFSVPKQSVFCILGPNGAGKTTLLRILTTVSHPDTGEVRIEGLNLAKQTLAIREKIGVVAQENRFDKYLSVWHNLTLHAQMHGIPKQKSESRITELLKQMDLYDRRLDMADNLSGGMQRRIALIRALIHEPQLLFLDEPTTGLDPEARLMIWKMIEQLKTHATVILTTHYMEEAECLSDNILMLNHGKVVAEGTAFSLKQALVQMGHYELILNEPKAGQYGEQLRSRTDILSDLKVIDDRRIEFHLSTPNHLKNILDTINTEDLLSIGQKEPDLEDVFLAVAARRN